MKVDVIQTSFAGGEFGPSLYGRTDIVQYANACEIVENMLPRSYGSAISMPGTRYVATTSDSTLKSRLIPFIFNRSDAYAIEMGDRYMRFFTDRGQVVTGAGTEDLSAFTANLIAHYKMNDNTNSTTVIDTVGTHNGTATTLTSSLSTTAIVSTGFNLGGINHISVADHANFTRTASTQPMTYALWAYYDSNGSTQDILSKAGEYKLSINSSDELVFSALSGTSGIKLLLHMDGTDGSTTFTDSGETVHTATANGNAQIDTAQQKFGTASGLFDGTGDYLSIPDHADWDFGTAAFTVDMWVRFNSTSGSQYLWSFPSDNTYGLLNAGSLIFAIEGVAVVSSGWVPTTGTWYHLAFIKETGSSNNVKMYVNGTQLGSTGSDSSTVNASGELNVGGYAGNAFLNGWLDEFRIVKGVAAWTANFTPPDVPYQVSATNTWKAADTISDGWHFIAAVFKGDGTASGDCKLYIDGLPSSMSFAADPSFVRMSDTSSLFRIGTGSAAGENNWASKLDNLAFLHQELTAANIASLYTNSAYQLTTVFLENELSEVHYTQLNDVIWLSHPNHPPQKLIRTSANEWTIADFAFVGGPFLDDNTTVTTITASATTGTVNITVTPTTTSLFTRSGSTLGHHNAYWMIGGLAQTNATTGLQEYGYVRVTHVINGYTATATVIKNLKVATATAVWAEGAWSAVRGYPSRVTLQEVRLWFARTNYEPQKEWASKVGVFEDFSLGTQADDDALNLPLASVESNEIQWLSGGKSLIAGTFGGGFVTNSGSTEPVTPDNANALEQIGFGADSIMPKKIGSFLYYVQRFGKKIREMFYNWEVDTYKATDRTILSPHILGDGVVDMAVQQNPETILYCVLTSGTLATMTREIDQDVTAWARHTTNGTYTSIAIIPSQSSNYDEAWVIVERWINGSQKRYVEYFEDVVVPTQQYNCLYLHSALTYSAYEQTRDSNIAISMTDVSIVTSDDDCGGHLAIFKGSATISTSVFVFGSGSARLPNDAGQGSGLVVEKNSDFDFGSGDFTIETRFRVSSFPASQNLRIVGTEDWDYPNYNGWELYYRLTGGGINTWFFHYSVGDAGFTRTIASTIAAGVWYNIAVSRSGNSLYFFQDGVQLGAAQSFTATIDDSLYDLAVGVGMESQVPATSHNLDGWIDELRISKGIGRYTANYTIADSAFSTCDAYTVLLLHLDAQESGAISTVTSSTTAFVSTDVGKRLRSIDSYGNTTGEGDIISYTSGTVVNILVRTTFGELTYINGFWGKSVTSVSGIDHLESETVGILADGLTESLTKTVASGAVSLDDDYFVVHVGLSYDQILQTLPKEAGTNRGTAQGKIQRINEVAFKVNRSTQNFKYGTDSSNLDDVNISFTPTVTTLYTGVLPPQGGGLTMRGGYPRGARVYIKNSNPLPIELLSIMSSLETYEK